MLALSLGLHAVPACQRNASAVVHGLTRRARAARRYNWFASHTQGTFLGPLASLMQNSYSKAQLSPLGRIYTSFKSKISNAAPLPDPTSALHDHMQARYGPMPRAAPGPPCPRAPAGLPCGRANVPPTAPRVHAAACAPQTRPCVKISRDRTGSAPQRAGLRPGPGAGAGPTGGVRARRRRCAARARRPPPTRPWSSRTSTCARCASSTAASNSERAARAAGALPHGPALAARAPELQGVAAERRLCVSSGCTLQRQLGGAALGAGLWPPGARTDAARRVVVSWAKACSPPGSCVAYG
jgi:hypothetical protein